MALPGDELLSSARLQRTHSRTIEAPPHRVWPWIAERVLVLGAPSLLPGGAPPGQGWGPSWATTWAFVLEPIGDAACRLVVRVRADYAPGPKMAILRPLLGALHELMQRAQLRNLGAGLSHQLESPRRLARSRLPVLSARAGAGHCRPRGQLPK